MPLRDEATKIYFYPGVTGINIRKFGFKPICWMGPSLRGEGKFRKSKIESTQINLIREITIDRHDSKPAIPGIHAGLK